LEIIYWYFTECSIDVFQYHPLGLIYLAAVVTPMPSSKGELRFDVLTLEIKGSNPGLVAARYLFASQDA